jgi:hypothetical protein
VSYYVIEAPHEADDHDRAVAEVLRMAPGSQNAFLWGCRLGQHTAWAFIEAEGRGDALDILPAFLRSRARIQRVERYTAQDVRSVWENAA